MRNKWIRYLQHSDNTEPGPWPLLLRKINQREDKKNAHKDALQRDTAETEYPLQVASWSCINPESDDVRHNTESVTLF